MRVGSADISDVREVYVCCARVPVEAVSVLSSRAPHCQFPCAFALTDANHRDCSMCVCTSPCDSCFHSFGNSFNPLFHF